MSQPDILQFQNGAPARPMFSQAEMQTRLQKLRAMMTARNLDAALFTSYHNINYYADFLYCSFGRLYGLAVDFKKSTVISALVDGGQPQRRARGNGAAENLIYTDWRRDNYFRAVQKLIKDGDTVAVEFDHINLQNFAKLKDALPNCKFVDIGAPAMELRIIKSPEEIEFIAQLARIADLGGAACVDVVAPGVGEHEIALASTAAMVRAIAKTWPHAELMDTWTWLQSGVNTDGAHNPVTSRKLNRGDILSMNCFPMAGGYYVALERTLFCQTASDEHRRLWEINCAVHDAGKELIKPGARCGDIAKALNEIYAAHDLLARRTFGYGHSFGVLCHYYGREAGLELREDVDTVLQPGMVLSMEPMIVIPEGMPGAGGYREHDILVVTEDGNRNLTGFPYGAKHNIVG